MRFLKFNKNWTRYKANDILVTFPTNSLSWDLLSYENISDLKNLHYGLIHNGFSSSCIDGLNPLFPYINSEHLPSKYELLKNGDLILADASEDRKDVGRPVEIIDIKEQNIVAGLHTIHARDNTNLIISGYKSFYFQSKAMKQQLYKVSNGSKIFGISPSVFKELIMLIPCKEEQEKIVNLLRKLEDKIDTQIKIIDEYESALNYIKDEVLWNIKDTKKYTVKDILSPINIKSTIQDEDPVLSSTVKGLFLQSEYFGKNISSENNIGYKKVKFGNIIISPQNLWMGNITYNNKFEKGIVSPSYHIFEVNLGFNPIYISLLLKSHKALYLYKSVSEQGASVVRRNLNIEAFNELCFSIPKIDVQNKIAEIITIVNNKINIEADYLAILNKQKQFLLNNLFV